MEIALKDAYFFGTMQEMAKSHHFVWKISLILNSLRAPLPTVSHSFSFLTGLTIKAYYVETHSQCQPHESILYRRTSSRGFLKNGFTIIDLLSVDVNSSLLFFYIPPVDIVFFFFCLLIRDH